MMDFIIKFASEHETFRIPEIQALAVLEGVDLTILERSEDSPFYLVRLPSVEAAKKLLRRSVLAHSIHELWGTGTTYEALHESVKSQTQHWWPSYKETSFKFVVDSYQGARSNTKKLAIINSFSFLPFEGPIRMANPDDTFTVFEFWPFNSIPLKIENPNIMYLGRLVGGSGRDIINKFDLKKRKYISTTSMDAELSLVTANIALAAPGKLFYDPFVGTGSFPVACAHFGAFGWGSDIDGRSIRGEVDGKNLASNFKQSPDYIPPKKAYSFLAMLDDILMFATDTLVDNGRLAFWMPSANDEEQEIPIPAHPCLELVAVCIQDFNKWSRKLITYRRLPDSQVSASNLEAYATRRAASNFNTGTTADELNPFRRGYFRKFEVDE
ncbi:tRNA (guanine(10)-N2)-methyltransferase [Cladobotryum mycophilum]|uniref:tRNA (Guanine(10)-N2)-methyltransferase n=1 Tax=Cladobotryum mycophilum TaxID=491253 RepID=A0ABR0SXJ7_9HYPO